ncbi:quinol dehydrogenase periplasmic component [Rubripirellula tenax]|uniref:Quinol dehydrogenase periplasmic component n=1 Tax=Rubripirellula tenax TaxID=2528015 RepID=A0A5C6EJI1_9BACT|nr:4Fe-4S dicluster domain-containing protein [Rubripirellula tenax]TWU48660.1 quinol dehydrogenase periplasmic component [Rubripirellula tenax]
MTDSREMPTHAKEESVQTESFVAKTAWLLAAIFRVPISVLRFLFRPVRPSRGRRDLIQGRFWKFIPSAKFAPLVTRYPKPEPATDLPTKSIQGISIAPVRPTDLSSRPSPRTIPVHRPPGAVSETQFMAGCTRCGDCMVACPYDAIVKAPARLGSVAGTPVIEADSSACMMCVDFPCIASCEPGVLVASSPPIMGTARVTEHLCLAHHHTTCTVCSERCPVGDAIAVTDGKPTINESTCTGCGVCRYVCPAPENAILLMPALERPWLSPRSSL